MHPSDTAADPALLAFVRQSSEDAVLLLDTEARITWANATAERLLGRDVDAMRGTCLEQFFTPEDQALGIAVNEIATARTGTAAEDDRWKQRPDGSRIWVTGVLMPLHDEAQRLIGFVKTFRNRTDLRQQIDTLQRQIEVEREHARRREAFLVTMAHELRNPLTPMLFTCQALADAPDVERVKRTAQMMEQQVGVLARLIDDLMNDTFVTADSVHLRRRDVSVNTILRHAATAMQSVFDARRQQFDVLLPDDAVLIHADAERLQQVFLNLLGNAAKFTPVGGHVWLKATTEANDCVVRVEDNGQGLAPEQMQRIFGMFARADPDGPVGGLGVGLGVVKALVEKHDGSVQVESDGPGTGAKFSVRLPLAESLRVLNPSGP